MNKFNHHILLIFLMFSSVLFSRAQKKTAQIFLKGPATVDELMKLKPISIGQLNPESDSINLVLPMPFSEAWFTKPERFKKLPPTNKVFAVYLFYTRYRESDSFDQPELNRTRFNEFKKQYPQIFNTEKIIWSVIEQVAPKTKDVASKTFHGFVIYLKSDELLDKIEADKKTIDHIINSYSDTNIYIPEIKTFKIKKKKIGTGEFIPRSKKKREAGILFSNPGIWNRNEKFITRIDTKFTIKQKGYWYKKPKFDSAGLQNFNELNLLTKRKPGAKTTVVMDVTGSMGPYIVQVLLWLRYHPEIMKQRRFLFFNDGDNMPDQLKKIGSTGGLYPLEGATFDSIKATMSAAMGNGQGGDVPENNIEALFEAQKRWPETDTFLMIADNEAPIKDLVLLKNIKRPVNVMLCGATLSTNPNLFYLAKETGGKLLFGDIIISDLKSFKTGDIITVLNEKWKFKDGTFLKISGTAN